MEGFLHHMAPQFLHPALQTFGCGAFQPIGGAFDQLYPSKAFARHLGEQYALGKSVGPVFRRVRDERITPPMYRQGPYGARDDTSSPGSAASASPRPCKEDDTPAPPCPDSHDFFSTDGENKSACGVCGTRLGPGVAQAHFLQELQHLYTLSAFSRDPGSASITMNNQDEDARWETYQRIRANRQKRLKLRTRKRHHTVESMLGYDLEDPSRGEGWSQESSERAYDAEDEPVDVESVFNVDAQSRPEKEQRTQKPKLHLSYAEDLEISSTNDTMQSPERTRSPNHVSLKCNNPPELTAEVSTSEVWSARSKMAATMPKPDAWPVLAAEAYIETKRHKVDGENLPSSTDSHK